MTYSGELFICMVLGLLLGHGLFNTSELKRTSLKDGATL